MFISVNMKTVVKPGQPVCGETLLKNRVDPARRVDLNVNSGSKANPGWYLQSNNHVVSCLDSVCSSGPFTIPLHSLGFLLVIFLAYGFNFCSAHTQRC